MANCNIARTLLERDASERTGDRGDSSAGILPSACSDPALLSLLDPALLPLVELMAGLVILLPALLLGPDSSDSCTDDSRLDSSSSVKFSLHR